MDEEMFRKLMERLNGTDPLVDNLFPYSKTHPFTNFGYPSKIVVLPDPYVFTKDISLGMEKLPPTQGVIYHGTSLAALDMILEDGVMNPPIVLLRDGKLVSGELKRTMDRDGDYEPKGPKFLSRDAMVRMGMLAADDPHFYQFGHAADICFDSLSGAISYADEDDQQKAVIGIDKKVLEFHGAKFLNGKGEGLLHEGPLPILMGLREIVVPEARVQEYRDKTSSKYLLKVYSLRDIK